MILVKEAITKEEILQAIFLRRKVLVAENKYSIHEDEPDEFDLTSKIYVAKENEKVVGTARIRQEKNVYRIQRMAVDKNIRSCGIGSKIINRILKDFSGYKIYLMAPKSTISFYEQFGFNVTDITQKGKRHTYYRMQNY